MTKPFWFEAITVQPPDNAFSPAIRGQTWRYCVGTGDNTPVALVAGPDDYTACARARIICKALNDEARATALAANHEGDE